ncbi:hypothetical protein HYS97_00610 [Candidatus Daviesbacteria bacterium]|nr:hypothetical protein [Candidatus Daviesbacteria bacterium]
MKNLPTNPKTLILIILIVLISVALMVLSFKGSPPKTTTQPSPYPKEASLERPFEIDFNSDPIVGEITPPKDTILLPGQILTIEISIETTQPESLEINIRSKDVIKENQDLSLEEFDKSFDFASKKLAVRLKSPIKPLHQYNINIRQGNKELLNLTYFSDKVLPQIQPKINLELYQYLPYETDSYTLNYVQLRNTYVFSFNYNPNSKKTLDQQFEEAKQDAIEFIESKGINVNDIPIEWNYH